MIIYVSLAPFMRARKSNYFFSPDEAAKPPKTAPNPARINPSGAQPRGESKNTNESSPEEAGDPEFEPEMTNLRVKFLREKSKKYSMIGA